MRGLVARIIESSFIDGPGHRAVVFMQGCNLSCLYCHNPETRASCRNCGLCIEACPQGALTAGRLRPTWEGNLCIGCDACLVACPHDSAPRALEYSPEELLSRIAKVSSFLDGLSFSGGECCLQADFLVETSRLIGGLVNAAGQRLTTIADTNGAIDAAVFDRLLGGLDGFILDLKAFDDIAHERLTGSGRDLILRNMEAAARAGKLVEVRSVLVEGYNDDLGVFVDSLRALAALGADFLYRLIPYRPQGVRGPLASMPAFPSGRYLAFVSAAREVLGDRVVTPPGF